MNWRADPFTRDRCADGSDWPRNGALLKGSVHEKDGVPWLRVSEIQQAGTTGFKKCGDHKWMGFDGGKFNGGRWLHDLE